ncbi:MAG TPA: STN domain-containing protein [Methylovirgula sp.]|nr:STN domain-containing protein [Methylovirgula sp.]
MEFDIPAQSLEDALYAFDATTGIEVIVDGHVTLGRKSTAVKGLLTPAEALRILLTGTGLDARRVGADAITLSIDAPAAAPENSALYRDYSAFIQQAVLRALCEEPDMRPGAYRIALQLRLDSSGIVSSIDLLGSTGDPQRDLRVSEVLRGLSIGALPPPDLPQPIVMVILPRSSQDSGDCR